MVNEKLLKITEPNSQNSTIFTWTQGHPSQQSAHCALCEVEHCMFTRALELRVKSPVLP